MVEGAELQPPFIIAGSNPAHTSKSLLRAARRDSGADPMLARAALTGDAPKRAVGQPDRGARSADLAPRHLAVKE